MTRHFFKCTVRNKEPLQLQALGFGAKSRKEMIRWISPRQVRTFSHVPHCSPDRGGVTGKAHAQAGSERWTLILNKLAAFGWTYRRILFLGMICLDCSRWFEHWLIHRYHRIYIILPKSIEVSTKCLPILANYQDATWWVNRRMGECSQNGFWARIVAKPFQEGRCPREMRRSGRIPQAFVHELSIQKPWRLELKLHCDSTSIFWGLIFFQSQESFTSFT